ncbi:DNA repair protein rad18 [Colletotrichum higginsianum]|uniref:Postreplication repair E3 ubiquitin-protein ligase RAD18 n=1 Tax=Colletotrichum higginsianum (strain IMI 349063) TaxID=759273 RepID=H1V5T3_COLHI|nr:DNA repair protein rad18 [Colletotrichum higginsianum IMI 349063]OBR12652.1 DNA repair protein rad18 [Colletotrichum higginsianum IMI 349063]CCF35585.1 DNA repair protein rad18 [Colletotrichum higginsianum]
MADFEDVPDSTDWLSTPLPALSTVEASLRCQVCKDFFKTPMLTSCCHTFCSLCIRRALANDGKCPLCRASDQELKLRSNWSMEEVVESFVKARKDTLHFARTSSKQTKTRGSPKRKLAAGDFTTGGDQPETKRLRSSARLSRTRSGQPTAVAAIHEEAEFEQPQEEEEEDDEVEDATFAPDDGLVPCPICSTRMKEAQVFRHLDTCTGAKAPTIARASTSRTSTPNTPARGGPRSTPAPDRLPALAYSMLKDTALRKKMTDLGLSTTGSRLQLEKRHKEWVTLWNANCDSARPKRRAELLHDLDVWERTQGSKAPMFVRPGVAVKDKEFDGTAWAAKHDTSFKDLIANARKSKAQALPKTEEAAAPASGDGSPAAALDVASSPSGMEAREFTTIDLTTRPPEVDRNGLEDEMDRNQGLGVEHGSAAAKPQQPKAAHCLHSSFSEPQIPSSQEAR